MKRTITLIAAAIALMLTLILPTAVAAQEQGYRTRAGDTLASIARQYCTTWQDIYYNNEGILGSDPNTLQSGVLIYVVDRCNQSSGVYDRGPSPYANGFVMGNIYNTAPGDTFYSIGVRFGLPWREISRANGGGDLYAGRQLRIPGLNQGPARPPAIQPAIKIISPQAGTVLPTQFIVSGTAQGLHAGSVVVRALDRSGNLLAQAVTSAQGHDVAIGGAGTWSVQLAIYVPPGTAGKIAAVGNGVSVEDDLAVTFGGAPPPAVQPSISIVNPQAFAALPPRFTVSGTGQGIGWNDIVVQAVDRQNRVLTEARTKLQGHDVGAGGQGTWSTPLEVYTAPGTPGMIRVLVAGTNANLSRDVTFGGQSGSPGPGQSDSSITRFTVDRQQINSGECVTFYWNTRNARTVYFYREGEQATANPAEANPDHVSACPPRTAVHFLQVIGQDGLSEIRAIRIWVGERQAGGPGPVIPTFTAIPDSLSVNRRCTTLNWTTGGSGLTAVTLYRNGQPLTNQNAASPYQDCVPDSVLGRDIVYELKVDSEFSGWTSRQVRVASVGG
jgi:LysM repeat protein